MHAGVRSKAKTTCAPRQFSEMVALDFDRSGVIAVGKSISDLCSFPASGWRDFDARYQIGPRFCSPYPDLRRRGSKDVYSPHASIRERHDRPGSVCDTLAEG